MALCTLEEWFGVWAFRGRSATSDTSESECLEKGRGSHVGQIILKKAERESPESVCYTGMPVWSGDSGVDRTTTTEAASSTNKKNKEGRQKNYERPQERGWGAMQPNRKIGEKPNEMGRPLGKDGCRQTSKEITGGKTARTQEKGKDTAQMGGLRDDEYEKIGGG